ncbi:MAG: response regulator [Vannielia sp.]|uniref:response regulator n=1 Tax=Rhodobacterales TaxID=204455 RepID=UPI002096177A|nr:response regulator [Oceanicola sp. 502str15]MCO6384635.1 response regulator [Oceanicola sp. 502str15]
MKTLTVDDDPIFREAFEAVLRHHDVTDIQSAASGQEALRIVSQQVVPFDCIFVDIQMPEMDGIELVGILRAMDPEGHSQIVMVTGMSGRQHIDQAFMAGAVDYITKPLEPLEFKTRLASIVRLHEGRRHNAAIQEQLKAATSQQHRYDFEDAETPPDVTGLISFTALRNYLKAIGRPRYAMSQRIGITVENAASIYVRTNDEEFLDIMGDVAEVIVDTLRGNQLLLAYAGSGDFLAVTTATHMASPDRIENQINTALEEFQETYLTNCCPVVRVGKPTRGSFFSRRSIDETIEETLLGARTRPNVQQYPRRKIA